MVGETSVTFEAENHVFSPLSALYKKQSEIVNC